MGINQTERKAIMDKMLQVSRVDPRLLAENNMGDGGQGPQEPVQTIEPRDIKIYREMMVEANA